MMDMYLTCVNESLNIDNPPLFPLYPPNEGSLCHNECGKTRKNSINIPLKRRKSKHVRHHDGHGHHHPVLRGGNADLNMTAAMSVVFAALWFYWAFSENGVKGFLAHIFAPKGDFTGMMRVGMILIKYAYW